MKSLSVFLLLSSFLFVYPIFGNITDVGQDNKGPIDITAQGSTTYQDGLAIATKEVSIVAKDTHLFADYASYNRETNEVLLVGNVRIYRSNQITTAQRALYNFETKSIRALDFRTEQSPFFFQADQVFSPGAGYQYNAQQATFTTHDSSKPDYHLTAKRLRIYPNDRAVLVGSTLYIGKTPVFYFPYFYQSLDDQNGFEITPGYSSLYGAYLGLGYSLPITDKLTGTAHLDLRSIRGIGGGVSLDYHPSHKPKKKVEPPPALPPFASDEDPGTPAFVGGENSSTQDDASAVSSLDAQIDDETPSTLDDQTPSTLDNQTPITLESGTPKSFDDDIHFLSYYTHDEKPDLNRTALPRLPIHSDRYRFDLKGTKYLIEDFTLKSNIDKLSDRYLLQDFYPGEFSRDPQPDNVAFLTEYHPQFLGNIIARAQLNSFFSTTERLPELTVDLHRRPIFTLESLNASINYESESSIGHYQRAFGNNSLLPNYSAYRADTFHQFTLPKTYFDWLSIIPRVGFRATYYSHRAPKSKTAYNLVFANEDALNSLFNTQLPPDPGSPDSIAQQEVRDANKAFNPGGQIFRPVFDTGVESSFKLSKVYNKARSRLLGIDQLQHIIQPYIDVSYIDVFGVDSRQILPFDRRLPTTQLDPIEFPLYTTIDSIDTGAYTRLGVRNKLQTHRDALTFDWLEMNSFFQVNIQNPYNASHFSNFFNELTFHPLPWVRLEVDAQFPLFDHATNVPQGITVSTGQKIMDFLESDMPNRAISGFTEINTSIAFQPISSLEIDLSHRYLDRNPFFQNSSLIAGGAYYQFNPNWAASFAEQYEFSNHILQAQNYTLYRDLSSFIASISFGIRDNHSSYDYVNRHNVREYGVMFNLTLKDIPQLSLPIGFGPSTTVGIPSVNR